MTNKIEDQMSIIGIVSGASCVNGKSASLCVNGQRLLVRQLFSGSSCETAGVSFPSRVDLFSVWLVILTLHLPSGAAALVFVLRILRAKFCSSPLCAVPRKDGRSTDDIGLFHKIPQKFFPLYLTNPSYIFGAEIQLI